MRPEQANAEAALVALRREIRAALGLHAEVTDASVIAVARGLYTWHREVEALREALGRPSTEGIGREAVAEISRLRGILGVLASDDDARAVARCLDLVRTSTSAAPPVGARPRPGQLFERLARMVEEWRRMTRVVEKGAGLDVEDLGLAACVDTLILHLRAERAEVARLREALVAREDATPIRGRARG